MNLGKKIRELRQEKGLTQQELADLLFVTRSAISNYEMEKRYPDLNTLKAMADYFEISVDELLSDEDYQRQPEVSEVLEEYLLLELVLYGILLIVYLIKLIMDLSIANHFLSAPYVTLSLLEDVAFLMLFSYCIYASVHKVMDARLIGTVLVIRLLPEALWHLYNILLYYGSGYGALSGLITESLRDFLLPLLLMMVSSLYFFKKQNTNSFMVYLSVLLSAGLSLYPLFNQSYFNWSLYDEQFVYNVLSVLSFCILYLLVVFQAYVLRKKRLQSRRNTAS